MPLQPSSARHISRIFMLGASGTIGSATLHCLVRRGHEVVAFGRPNSAKKFPPLPGVEYRFGNVVDPDSIRRDGFCGEKFDLMLSCMASRNGLPDDAWAIDYQAHVDTLAAAKKAGVKHVVLLSAICVQKPLLAFQHAKLAFEKRLIDSGMAYSIVRPTAFFKSLSGQVDRVKKGKPFLVFGDGSLTACKPISDRDLANYLADCIENPDLQNRILPVGGPGDAISLKQQGDMLFELTGNPPRFRHIPVGTLDFIIACLSRLSRVIPKADQKAELAKIGRYYATESMLVWNAEKQEYDASATPSTGSDTLRDHYLGMLNGDIADDRGEHSVF